MLSEESAWQLQAPTSMPFLEQQLLSVQWYLQVSTVQPMLSFLFFFIIKQLLWCDSRLTDKHLSAFQCRYFSINRRLLILGGFLRQNNYSRNGRLNSRADLLKLFSQKTLKKYFEKFKKVLTNTKVSDIMISVIITVIAKEKCGDEKFKTA